MKISNRKQSGFTLIELVMVIAILGVLSAVALPRFVDLRNEASVAAVAGVVGAINAADGVNVASAAVGRGQTTQGLTCANAVNAILQTPPTGVAITGADLSGIAGTSNTCTVTSTADASISGQATITSVN